jgi:hypothetical protein
VVTTSRAAPAGVAREASRMATGSAVEKWLMVAS